MTDVANKPLDYNTANPKNLQGLIASNGVLHDRAVAAATRILEPSR
jgi:hypothetical protein